MPDPGGRVLRKSRPCGRDTRIGHKCLDILKEKVINCFAGAAAATGAVLKYRWADVRYAPMLNNIALAKLFRKNMQSLGYDIPLGSGDKWSGSSDVGNVSQLAPAIQPMVAIA